VAGSVKQPDVTFALKPGTASDLAVKSAFEQGTIGPFECKSKDGWEGVYFPAVRVTARVVRSDRVIYWCRRVE